MQSEKNVSKGKDGAKYKLNLIKQIISGVFLNQHYRYMRF